jgi:membrane dipeptidase
MRRMLIYILIAFPFPASPQTRDGIHFHSILVDTHNDILSSSVLDGLDITHRLTTGHSDLVRWKEGGLDVQFFSVWTGKLQEIKKDFTRMLTRKLIPWMR